MTNVLDKALELLMRYPLCSSCLGRQFATLGSGLSNEGRGNAIKTMLLMRVERGKSLKEEDLTIIKTLARTGFDPAVIWAKELGLDFDVQPCYICGGKLAELNSLAREILLALGEVDYNTFLVGSLVPNSILKREEEVRGFLGMAFAESIKREVNRRIGRILQEKTGKEVDFKRPDVLILIDLKKMTFSIRISPLYIYGRYRKVRRGLAQSRWPCRICQGVGCDVCDYRGKLRPLSVEELISSLVLTETGGSNAVLHAAGREDIDARMLGSGRPFVLEVRDPRRRKIDLKSLEREINYFYRGLVEVYDLKIGEHELLRYFKLTSRVRRKLYRVRIELSRELNDDVITKIEKAFLKRTIYQRTPTRVLHRRADRTREKEVYKLKVLRHSKKSMEVLILAQGGLYIKELISGDNGRTSPSLAEELNDPSAKCLSLDVIEVEG